MGILGGWAFFNLAAHFRSNPTISDGNGSVDLDCGRRVGGQVVRPPSDTYFAADDSGGFFFGPLTIVFIRCGEIIWPKIFAKFIHIGL